MVPKSIAAILKYDLFSNLYIRLFKFAWNCLNATKKSLTVPHKNNMFFRGNELITYSYHFNMTYQVIIHFYKASLHNLRTISRYLLITILWIGGGSPFPVFYDLYIRER